jgi:alkaline phosphatase
VPAGQIDPDRDLLGDFEKDGFAYAPDRSGLMALPVGTQRILGLFNFSNMNVSLDKIAGRRGTNTLVNDYGFPDQPMLDEMTAKALAVLERKKDGFVLMVEGASIDKSMHPQDAERAIGEMIDFDNAIGLALNFARARADTLVLVTADHAHGFDVYGTVDGQLFNALDAATPDPAQKQAFRIPQQAVQEMQGKRSVLVVDAENKVQYREVAATTRSGNDWIVESGLTPGEMIVVEGTGKARPGAPVKPTVIEVSQIGAAKNDGKGEPKGDAKSDAKSGGASKAAEPAKKAAGQ